jgi:hypothetical protein
MFVHNINKIFYLSGLSLYILPTKQKLRSRLRWVISKKFIILASIPFEILCHNLNCLQEYYLCLYLRNDSVGVCCLTSTQQFFSYIMAISFSGGRSWSTRREPPAMGKQLVNFLTCSCESNAPFFVIYKVGCKPTPYWWQACMSC